MEGASSSPPPPPPPPPLPPSRADNSGTEATDGDSTRPPPAHLVASLVDSAKVHFSLQPEVSSLHAPDGDTVPPPTQADNGGAEATDGGSFRPPHASCASPVASSEYMSRQQRGVLSLSPNVEGTDRQVALKVSVDVVDSHRHGLDFYEVNAHHKHTIHDLKSFFEHLEGNQVHPIKLAASQNGVTLSNTTLIKDLDLNMSVTLIAVSETVEPLTASSNFPAFQEPIIDPVFTLQDFSITDMLTLDCDAGAEDLHTNDNFWELEEPVDFWELEPVNFWELEEPEPSPVDSMNFPQAHESTAANLNQEDLCEDTLQLPTLSEPQVPERLLVPSNFSDQQLSEADVHGFMTSYELRASINSRADRWMTPNQYYGLLSNPMIFSVDDVHEHDKRDGIICVIDSTSCRLPKRLIGYKVKPNELSDESRIGDIKCNGISMEWHEARGKIWTRRRLILQGSDMHVIQWQHFPLATRKERHQACAQTVRDGEHRGLSTTGRNNEPQEPPPTAQGETSICLLGQVARLQEDLEKNNSLLERALNILETLQQKVESLAARQQKMEAMFQGSS